MRDYESNKATDTCHVSTLREKLKNEIDYRTHDIVIHEGRIKEAKALLARLDKNKDLESIVDFLQSGR